MVKQKLDIGLFSCMYSQTNGTAHSVRFLSEALASTGHNIHVFAPRIEDGHKKPVNLHFHDLGGARISKKTGFVLSLPFHKYFFCQEDYLDIAHIHTHATIGSMAVNWAKFLGIPMIGSHGSPLQFYAAQYVPIVGKLLTKFDLTWRYERHIFDKYDLIHVPGKSKKEQLRDMRFKEPIVCLTNGISDYYYKNINKNGIRDKYNIEGKKVLLYASRFSPEKHMLSVIKKFREIRKEVPDAHLLCVGSDGPSKDPCARYVKRHYMSDYVSVVGHVPFEDLLRLYNTADISCLWSWIEAEGLVLLEAMAQGTPSVGANGCGIRDVIKHGKTGYLANNLDEFKERVVKLMKDDDLRAEFSKNCKEISQNFKHSKIAQTWIKMYKFTINELYPLKYYGKERKERVELLKEFIKKEPSLTF
ncbi:MAG: glycosyltransferase [Candidatus Lokiarchaeota archaeon]|nr:glycosyltransferase [Candidatus Lokiarchaeota archaeon]